MKVPIKTKSDNKDLKWQKFCLTRKLVFLVCLDCSAYGIVTLVELDITHRSSSCFIGSYKCT